MKTKDTSNTLLLHPEIVTYRGYLGYVDKDNIFHPRCRKAYAPVIRKDLETGMEDVHLYYASKRACSPLVPREVVAKADISELARYGVEISNSSKYYFGLHMEDQLNQAKLILILPCWMEKGEQRATLPAGRCQRPFTIACGFLYRLLKCQTLRRRRCLE